MKRGAAIAAAFAFVVGVSFTALAQESEASKKYMEIMHQSMNMDMKMTGDPDKDFIMMMIPHHQGAVDMARVVLQYGKDPEVKKMAEDVVAAQEKEILWMKQWLQKNGE